MKRRIVGLLFALCVIVFSVIWLLQNHRPIDQTTYDAISLGMSEEEVTKLVPIAPGTIAFSRAAQLVAEAGQPPFEVNEAFVKGEDGVFVYFDATTKKELGKERVWQTNEYSLQVLFSPDGKVMRKQLYRFVNRMRVGGMLYAGSRRSMLSAPSKWKG